MVYKIRRVQKTGFSLGVTIPTAMAQLLGFKPGDEVRVYVVGDVFCVRRVGAEGFAPGVIAVSPQIEHDRISFAE